MYESDRVEQEVWHQNPINNRSTNECNKWKHDAQNFCPSAEVMCTHVGEIQVGISSESCHSKITKKCLQNLATNFDKQNKTHIMCILDHNLLADLRQSNLPALQMTQTITENV